MFLIAAKKTKSNRATKAKEKSNVTVKSSKSTDKKQQDVTETSENDQTSKNGGEWAAHTVIVIGFFAFLLGNIISFLWNKQSLETRLAKLQDELSRIEIVDKIDKTVNKYDLAKINITDSNLETIKSIINNTDISILQDPKVYQELSTLNKLIEEYYQKYNNFTSYCKKGTVLPQSTVRCLMEYFNASEENGEEFNKVLNCFYHGYLDEHQKIEKNGVVCVFNMKDAGISPDFKECLRSLRKVVEKIKITLLNLDQKLDIEWNIANTTIKSIKVK